jgi:hypothetical protein
LLQLVGQLTVKPSRDPACILSPVMCGSASPGAERNLAVTPPHGVVITLGVGRLNAVTETRRITFEGSGPFVRTLVQALEDEGVTVAVRREGHYVDQRPTPRGMGDAVKATLVATGASEAIAAGVSTFRQRFANRAMVTIENEAAPPPPRHHRQGQHRA